DALLVRAARESPHVLLVVGDDADSPSADACIAAQQRFAIFGAIFLEFAGVDHARDDFAHVVLLARIVSEDAVDFLLFIQRLARSGVAEWRSGRRTHFVYQRSNAANASVVIGFAEVDRAANLRVHFRAA